MAERIPARLLVFVLVKHRHSCMACGGCDGVPLQWFKGLLLQYGVKKSNLWVYNYIKLLHVKHFGHVQKPCCNKVYYLHALHLGFMDTSGWTPWHGLHQPI